MTDPLEVLRRPLVPLAPDPAFAAGLRERIRRALSEDSRAEGEDMTTRTAPRLVSEGDVVYLSLQVGDGARATAFYGAVLGWTFGPVEPGHSAQVQGQSLPIGIWDGAPSPGIRRPGVLLVRRVADLAASVAAVRSLGGEASEPHQEPYGLMADCADDQGNGFTLMEMPADAPRPEANGERDGDVAYITVSPGDEGRASRFYGELFGWEFTPGTVPHGLNVEGPRPMTGMWGGTGRPVVDLMFRVADIEVAVRRVRDAGGIASDPDRQPYGITANCTDDQGMRFTLGQLS
jgi:predicted enzyme related to lactoylglutathione lyase